MSPNKWRSAVQGEDIESVMLAFRRDLDARAEVYYRMAVSSGILVEAVVDFSLAGEQQLTTQVCGLWRPGGDPILTITLQVLHKAFHLVDQTKSLDTLDRIG